MRIPPLLFSMLLLLHQFRLVWSQSSNSTNGSGGTTDLQLCRCQASWEELYGGQRRRRRRLSALYPGVNYNNVEKRGRYFVIDNLIVLPNSDPKCGRNGNNNNNGKGKGNGNGSLFFRGIRIGHRALGEQQQSMSGDGAPLQQQQHLQRMTSSRSRGAAPPREVVESSESHAHQPQLRQESTMTTSSDFTARRGLQEGRPKVFPCPANINPNPAPRPTKKPSTRSPASAPSSTTVEPTTNPTAGSSSETNEPTPAPTDENSGPTAPSTAVPTSSTAFPTSSTKSPTGAIPSAGASPTPAPTAAADDQNLDDVLNTPTSDPTVTASPTPTDNGGGPTNPSLSPAPLTPSSSATFEPTVAPSPSAPAPPTATDDATQTSGPTSGPTVGPTAAGAVTKFAAAAETLSAPRDGNGGTNHAKSAEEEEPMTFLEALGGFKEIQDGGGN